MIWLISALKKNLAYKGYDKNAEQKPAYKSLEDANISC